MPKAPVGTPLDAFSCDVDAACEAWTLADDDFDVTWVCCRWPGHDGPHVAAMGPDPETDWCATWEDDQ